MKAGRRGVAITPDVLMHSCFDAVFGYVYYRVHRRRDVAEDLTQDVFVTALQKLNTLDWSEPLALMHTFARHRIARYYERQAVEVKGQERKVEEALAKISRVSLPERAQEQVELGDRINATLALLSDEQRTVILEKYLRDRAVDAIARDMQRSPKAVEALLFKARRRLQELWDEESA